MIDPARQPTLFDPEQAELAAEAGMAQAASADRVQLWKQAATTWIGLLEPGVEFTADDLVRAVGLPDVGPNRNNVVGAVFSGAARSRLIVFAGRLRRSERLVRHGNLQRVWRRT